MVGTRRRKFHPYVPCAPSVFLSPRPNLHFAVRAKATSNQAIAKDMYDYIASIGHLRSTGIIYCYSKVTKRHGTQRRTNQLPTLTR